MKRSEFIKAFGLGGSGLIVPQSNFLQKPIKIYDNYIKGLVHYSAKKALLVLKEGDALTLQRITDNVYDSFAISVHYNTYKLGYIAAYENTVLANLIDQGVTLKAFVSQINTNDIYQAISLEVYAHIVIENPKLITTNLLEQRADDAKDVYRGSNLEM